MLRFFRAIAIFVALTVLLPATDILAVPPEATVAASPESPAFEDIIMQEDAIAYFDIPADILENLNKSLGSLKRPGATAPRKTVRKDPLTADGYRIQVFSDGSNPATLQARAKARGNMIVAKFPKYRGQIYSFSASPNWYTRVGNFQTSEEAQKALAELKRAFPGFAAEMRIVKSTVKIIK